MIKTNLYHKKCFWKPHFDKAVRLLLKDNTFRISSHIRYSTNTWCDHDKIDLDKLETIMMEVLMKERQSYLFEVETEYNTETHFETITKAVFRTEYNDNKDIVIVVRENLLVTTWLQDKADRHCTLNPKKYVNLGLTNSSLSSIIDNVRRTQK